MSELTDKLGITSGPWSTDLNDFHDLCIYDTKGDWVANLDEKKENALLIAAAPEMLEALIKFVKSVREHSHRIESITIIEKATGKTWKDIKKLIKCTIQK